LCVDDRELLEWFLANGADPNRRCAIDMTPLSTAVQAAPWDILQLMLSSGGSFERGQLLQHAARRKDDCIKVLQLILDHGAPINNVEFQDDLDSYYQQRALGLGTALHGTACQGKIDVITFLTDREREAMKSEEIEQMAKDRLEGLDYRGVLPFTDESRPQAPPPATQLSHDELMSLIEALTNTPGDARKQEANANGLATALGQVIRAVAGGLERKNGGQANDGGGRTDVKPRGGPWPWW
ncbi:hypothetical protein B0A55_12979, partial [Friedmanniomyces simplex]